MPTARGWTTNLAAGVLLAAAAPAPGQAPVSDPRQLEARVARMEQTLSSSTLLRMHETVQALSKEIRELRGEIEVQSHEIDQLKQRQRDLYVDMDRRLQVLEAAGPVAAAPPAHGTPPATGTPPAPGNAVAPGTPSSTAAAPPAAPAPPAPPAPPPGTVASVDPAAEQQAYREAFELLKGGKFTEASAALTKFLADYPNGRFADNAQYWLGESYYVSRDFGASLKAFEKLIVDFPDSPKRSHAMLKIGFIHDEQGRKDQAKQVLSELIRIDPQSTAAGLAEKRLKRLQ